MSQDALHYSARSLTQEICCITASDDFPLFSSHAPVFTLFDRLTHGDPLNQPQGLF